MTILTCHGSDPDCFEDGIYLHKLFDIAYLVKGDKVMIRDPEKLCWESSEMDRWHMQLLLDNGLIYRTL